jgi:uncharacterized Fe-S radical SAM superfamily protein PflX
MPSVTVFLQNVGTGRVYFVTPIVTTQTIIKSLNIGKINLEVIINSAKLTTVGIS